MWSNLVLANPRENENMHCQDYWSIQLLRGVQQAPDREAVRDVKAHNFSILRAEKEQKNNCGDMPKGVLVFSTLEDITAPESQEEKERKDWLSDPADGSNTVKSVLTVQEYFAKRMAKLKGAQKETKADNPSPTADEALEPLEELETKVKKKKKKQKREEEAERTERGEKQPERGLDGQELEAPLNECQRGKKKRKHKEQHEGESPSCDENMGNGEVYLGIPDGEDLGVKDHEAKQKKRQKKKHKKQKEEVEKCGEGAPRKKKKHCKHI
ncbi:PIN2/TERF1-interacting telomerase inhibitor 1-like protein [Willisornis vidua]|uniref:PIN2/TERF1-interacting telomerase inhibitor 1-like protein n=1 Tax=Willisornis vidua TaxID=1566151 RepID=A0ABQ9DM96_9PASS|nr:PIN2/TERF1-interacting telomerase inhibitor 1-like protein [Willisornis vidua]